VSPVLEFALAVALPTAAGFAVVLVGRAWRWRDDRGRPQPAVPIERLGADLRRLHEELDRTENAPSRLPGKHMRCRAVRAAYLDALRAACRAVDVVPPSPEDPALVSQAEIYRVEAALRVRGMEVRPVGQS
jgi:hypothetical protein